MSTSDEPVEGAEKKESIEDLLSAHKKALEQDVEERIREAIKLAMNTLDQTVVIRCRNEMDQNRILKRVYTLPHTIQHEELDGAVTFMMDV
jgi:hypothetical protein